MKIIRQNKGFILAEAVITSVFVLGIFTFVLANVFPLIGKYERTLQFDNLEDVFLANNFREVLEKTGVDIKSKIGSYTNTVSNIAQLCGNNNDFCKSVLDKNNDYFNITNIVIQQSSSSSSKAHLRLDSVNPTYKKRAFKAYARYFNNNNSCGKNDFVVMLRFYNENDDSNEEKPTYSSFCVGAGE